MSNLSVRAKLAWVFGGLTVLVIFIAGLGAGCQRIPAGFPNGPKAIGV